MNAILSVNCVYLCAIQRLFGDSLLARICKDLFETFKAEQKQMTQGKDGDQKTKMKNILNCFLHFFLFKGVNGQILFDLIKILMNSFSEGDIEILIFILHNIGL